MYSPHDEEPHSGTFQFGGFLSGANSRVLLLMLGLAGAIWSAVTLPTFVATAPIQKVVARITAGDSFKPAVLNEIKTGIGTKPKPLLARSDMPRARALIQQRVAEHIEAKNAGERDRDTVAADQEIRTSLQLNPSDSFLWLLLYSLRTSTEGFDKRSLRYLEWSYVSAPREGWIAVLRNREALAVFARVNESTRQRILIEFASLVDSGFLENAALNLTGVGWSEHLLLMSSLTHVDIIAREAFARILAREGVKVPVPGVQIDERLWR